MMQGFAEGCDICQPIDKTLNPCTRRFKMRPVREKLRSRPYRLKKQDSPSEDKAPFSCPICRDVLKSPVTVECGHTFCHQCLNRKGYSCSECCVTLPTSRMPRVNVLVQNLAEKWKQRSVDCRKIAKSWTNDWACCITSEDLECILCSRCFLDPVTTTCGHTFCRDCLIRALDHRLACPLCTGPLEPEDYFKMNTIVLDEALRLFVPEEFEERLRAKSTECFVIDTSSYIPVFICTNAFPGVACPLNVYEPRYRLLTRRCLRSPTKRFAMASKENHGNKFAEYGTILEVKDAVTLNDGRILLTTVGMRRFKVVNQREQDGYDTAKVHYIKDIQVPKDRLPELITLHEKVHSKAVKWVQSLKSNVLAEVEQLIGEMPKIEDHWSSLPDGPTWAWWLMPILPLSTQLQVGFLSTTSLEKRLRAIDKMLDHIKFKMKALQRDNEDCLQQEETLEYCRDSQNRVEENLAEI